MGHVKRDFHLNESICGEFIYKKGTFWLCCFQALFGRWMKRAEVKTECWLAVWGNAGQADRSCPLCSFIVGNADSPDFYEQGYFWSFSNHFMIYLFVCLFILRCMAKMREMKITMIIIMSQMALQSGKLVHYFIHNYVKWIFKLIKYTIVFHICLKLFL